MKTTSANTRRWWQALLLAAALAVPAVTQAKPVVPELSAGQLAELKNGGMVVVSQDVPGGSWPKLTVYTLVNASVQAVNHVFTDYAHASTYIPDLISADVVGRPKPGVVDVKYTTHMPIVGQTSYSVRNTYSQEGGDVIVKWTLLQSSLASESTGSLRVEPYDKGSILRYSNYVQPKIPLAGLVKSAALTSVKSTVAAIKKEAEQNPNAGN